MFPPNTCCKKNQLQYKNSNYQEFTIKGHVDDEHNIVMFVIAQESTLNNHRKRYQNLVPIKNQILDLEDVFYQPTYSNLQKSNIHFLKCYVRHMYMFRDREPILMINNVNSVVCFDMDEQYLYSLLYNQRYRSPFLNSDNLQ